MDWESILNITFRNVLSIDTVYFALAAIGLNVQFGYGGLLNFGQAGFLATGAYGMGMTAHYFQVSPWLGLVFGLVYAVGLGLLMGIPTLRLRSDYLAIVTIAAAEVIRLIVRSVRFKQYFGGSDGINRYADEFYSTKGWLIGNIDNGKRYGFGPFTYSGRELRVMIVGWALIAVIGFLVWLLMRSPWGRVLKGIREDEDAVRSLGKNVFAYKMQALILGGVIGMVAGVILAISRGSVQPDNYSREVTFYILTALVLGGVATISGSIVGPMIFWMVLAFAEAVLIESVDSTGQLTIGGVSLIKSTGQIGQIRFMLVGALLMLLMIFRPQGIFGNRKEMALDDR
ncbi:MAG: branched-chain amino acid ABC transporter permease [Acidimicrobiia bacterium]